MTHFCSGTEHHCARSNSLSLLTILCLFLSLCLQFCLFISLSLCLHVCVSFSLSLFTCLCLFFSLSLFTCLCLFFSFCFCIYVYCLSISQSVHFCLSIMHMHTPISLPLYISPYFCVSPSVSFCLSLRYTCLSFSSFSDTFIDR